jgi:hypothetical protein
MLEANGRINLCFRQSAVSPEGATSKEKRRPLMADILNLAVPYFSLLFIGFAFASVVTLTSVMWFIQTGRLAFP